MGHAADQSQFTLLQQDVAELIDLLKNCEAARSPGQGSQVQQAISEAQVTPSFDALQIRIEEHSENFQRLEMPDEEIRVAALNLEKENKQILDKLVSIEGLLSAKLQGMEKDLTETSEKVKELEQESIQMKKDITCLYNRQGNIFTIKHQFLRLMSSFVEGEIVLSQGLKCHFLSQAMLHFCQNRDKKNCFYNISP